MVTTRFENSRQLRSGRTPKSGPVPGRVSKPQIGSEQFAQSRLLRSGRILKSRHAPALKRQSRSNVSSYSRQSRAFRGIHADGRGVSEASS